MKNPYPLTSNESMRFHAQTLMIQKLDELQDSLGRYSRHLEASVVKETIGELGAQQVAEMEEWVHEHGALAE